MRFVPIRFKPVASVFKDEQLGGVNIVITDRRAFRSVRTGIEIATALRLLYPNEWQSDRYARLLVNQDVLGRLKAGLSAELIEASWQKELENFKDRWALYLLYK
ncbi:exo-beta-N-acetylmuramidase NamZ domain-containing protein [Leptolyngbya sp. 7M]|uniref:exo-beta-N-acetylmuramidase NamZ domain-containing protein n=1 Tax=Leptolyngbya sp. 7M TaxID=2812896 RepID=UPI0021F20370|nr:exo-beta-N-acetylmuramidase NamZ domain-containing protein [Leptolyngbya sp. 7M]